MFGAFWISSFFQTLKKKVVRIRFSCFKTPNNLIIYRLTHSASELSGFTCTSSLTMNEKFQYRTRPPSAVLKILSSLLVNECR